MKYLGIDYGAKRVGIAVSDEGGSIAFPRGTLINDSRLMAQIQDSIRQEGIGAVVVGDTRTHGGADNPVSAAADAFAAALATESGLTVERGWEAWSSIESSRFAPKGHEHDDAAAAAFILQRFLDMHKNGIQ